MTMHSARFVRALFILVSVTTAAACEKAQLLAPTNSTITLSAPTRVLPAGGSTEVTAVVVEQSGTPVQNGTTVRFSTSLGRVDPVEAQTRNGVATTTFFAGANSGVAEIRGISGGAGGGTSTGTGTGTSATATAANVIQITIGAAAVNTVTLRANPASVGPNGGTVELIAAVVAENGRLLEGILVTFNASQGQLGSPTAVTDSSGEARTTLTTSFETKVTATAGIKTSTPETTITVRPGPVISITCAPSTGSTGANCGAVQASSTGNTANVVFTVTRPATGSSTIRTVTISFGDGTSQALGNLGGGTATVTHTYNGPSGETPVTYEVTVQATDISGESTSASTSVTVTPKPVPTPISVNLTSAEVAGQKTLTSARWTFTAAATGGGEGTANGPFESYSWGFGDGSTAVTSGNQTSHTYTSAGPKTVTVTVRTPDGRTGSAREEIIVTFTPPPAPTPISVNLTAAESTPKTTTSVRWTFKATATGGGEGTANGPFESYRWVFGDGSAAETSGNETSHNYTVAGPKTVTVTVRTPDGRTGSAREEIVVTFAP